jgi:hypothetical protein
VVEIYYAIIIDIVSSIDPVSIGGIPAWLRKKIHTEEFLIP